MGGINPKRYKTLCKIRKLYPDAKIFEIMDEQEVFSMLIFIVYIPITDFIIDILSSIGLVPLSLKIGHAIVWSQSST